MRYRRSFEKAAYERKFNELIALLVIKNAHSFMQDHVALANPSIKLEMLHWPFDDLWF